MGITNLSIYLNEGLKSEVETKLIIRLEDKKYRDGRFLQMSIASHLG